MATLNEAIDAVVKANGARAPLPAARTETLQPSAWLESCQNRPVAAVTLGLRTPNEAESRQAQKLETEDEAIVYYVARGICDPRDCRKSHPVFDMPDDQLRMWLKPATIRYLFDRIEQLNIETSPTVPAATDEELFLLGMELQAGEALDALPEPKRARVRRLATHIYEALGLNA